MTMPVRGLDFNPLLIETGGYTLMISSSESDRPDSDKGLMFLNLGPDGRRVLQPQLLNIDKVLELSMSPVTSQVNGLCGFAAASSLLNTIRAQYKKVLDRLQAILEAFWRSRSTKKGRLSVRLPTWPDIRPRLGSRLHDTGLRTLLVDSKPSWQPGLPGMRSPLRARQIYGSGDHLRMLPPHLSV